MCITGDVQVELQLPLNMKCKVEEFEEASSGHGPAPRSMENHGFTRVLLRFYRDDRGIILGH